MSQTPREPCPKCRFTTFEAVESCMESMCPLPRPHIPGCWGSKYGCHGECLTTGAPAIPPGAPRCNQTDTEGLCIGACVNAGRCVRYAPRSEDPRRSSGSYNDLLAASAPPVAPGAGETAFIETFALGVDWLNSNRNPPTEYVALMAAAREKARAWLASDPSLAFAGAPAYATAASPSPGSARGETRMPPTASDPETLRQLDQKADAALVEAGATALRVSAGVMVVARELVKKYGYGAKQGRSDYVTGIPSDEFDLLRAAVEAYDRASPLGEPETAPTKGAFQVAILRFEGASTVQEYDDAWAALMRMYDVFAARPSEAPGAT